MRRIQMPLFSLGGLAVLAAASPSPQFVNHCRASDSWATKTQAKLDSLLTRTDTLNVLLRQALSLTQITSGQIAFVTDTAKCRQAADAINSRVGTLTNSGGLLEAGVSVFDDDDDDTLIGGSGRDLIFGDTNPWDGAVDTIALQPLLDVLVAVN